MTNEVIFKKAYGSMMGLAMGDAMGFPAMYHRTLKLNWGRGILWEFSKQADEHNINKFSLPFTLSQPEENLHICGTDDTEYATVSALILTDAGKDPSLARLARGWEKYIVTYKDSIWSGVSERASITNFRKGLEAPTTGNDNPHHFDDGAVARAVPIGLKFYKDPDYAAKVAEDMASITNAEDGVYAAQAMAASIATAVNQASVNEIVEAGRQFIPADSWLGRKVEQALDILHNHGGSGFAAVPEWNNRVVNGIYNYGNVAPETLAIAYAIFLSTNGDLLEGLQLAAIVPKQADSMPAMVGALAGARQGIEVVPSTWVTSLDAIHGVCIPHLQGYSLKAVVEKLMV